MSRKDVDWRVVTVWSDYLTSCTDCAGVTNYKVSGSDLAGTYKKGAAAGCQTASCGLYANEVQFPNKFSR